MGIVIENTRRTTIVPRWSYHDDFVSITYVTILWIHKSLLDYHNPHLVYEPTRPQFVFVGSYGRSYMFGTWYLPYPNGGGIFTEMYSDYYFGTVDSPDGTTSDSGSRLSTLVRCTEIRLSSVVVVQLRSNPGCADWWPLHLFVHVVGSGWLPR